MKQFAAGLFLSLTILAPLTPSHLHAQAVANAQIHGIVQDHSGAVVAVARMRATQVETGRVQTAISQADGVYSLPNLPVGSYSIEVTAPGFKTATLKAAPFRCRIMVGTVRYPELAGHSSTMTQNTFAIAH